jgi:hypothetical protein
MEDTVGISRTLRSTLADWDSVLPGLIPIAIVCSLLAAQLLGRTVPGLTDMASGVGAALVFYLVSWPLEIVFNRWYRLGKQDGKDP